MSAPVLYVIGSLDVGGAETHLTAVAGRLDRARFRPTIYTLVNRGAKADEMQAAGIEVIEPWGSAALRRQGAAAKALLLAASALRLLLLMLRRRPAIVHCFLPAAYLLGGLCAVLTRRPVLAMSRRSLNRYQARHPLLAGLEHALFPRTDALLGNSRAVLAELAAEGARPERLGLIGNGVDLAAFDAAALPRAQARAALGLAADGLVMVIVANWIPYKGHADLLEALRLLPGDWTLVCMGRDDGIGAELRRRTDELGLSARVRWLGFRADASRLLAAADIGLLASHEEGFSNTLLEYMAAGLPVVATQVGGNVEAVAEGRTGLLVPPHDPPALARALATLAADPARRTALGREGRARVAERFSLAAAVARYERLYDGLLARRPGPVAQLIEPAGQS